MIDPSSSHIAGTVRIGFIARKLLGETIREVTINLSGSFLDTGTGNNQST